MVSPSGHGAAHLVISFGTFIQQIAWNRAFTVDGAKAQFIRHRINKLPTKRSYDGASSLLFLSRLCSWRFFINI